MARKIISGKIERSLCSEGARGLGYNNGRGKVKLWSLLLERISKANQDRQAVLLKEAEVSEAQAIYELALRYSGGTNG